MDTKYSFAISFGITVFLAYLFCQNASRQALEVVFLVLAGVFGLSLPAIVRIIKSLIEVMEENENKKSDDKLREQAKINNPALFKLEK